MMGMLDLEGIDGRLDWIFWLFGKLMRMEIGLEGSEDLKRTGLRLWMF